MGFLKKNQNFGWKAATLLWKNARIWRQSKENCRIGDQFVAVMGSDGVRLREERLELEMLFQYHWKWDKVWWHQFWT